MGGGGRHRSPGSYFGPPGRTFSRLSLSGAIPVLDRVKRLTRLRGPAVGPKAPAARHTGVGPPVGPWTGARVFMMAGTEKGRMLKRRFVPHRPWAKSGSGPWPTGARRGGEPVAQPVTPENPARFCRSGLPSPPGGAERGFIRGELPRASAVHACRGDGVIAS